jgi:hypothetical protein
MHTLPINSALDTMTNGLPSGASIEGNEAAPIASNSSGSSSVRNDMVGNKRDRASIEQEASMNGAAAGG